MLDNTVSPRVDRTRSSGSLFVEKSEWPLIRRRAEEKAYLKRAKQRRTGLNLEDPVVAKAACATAAGHRFLELHAYRVT